MAPEQGALGICTNGEFELVACANFPFFGGGPDLLFCGGPEDNILRRGSCQQLLTLLTLKSVNDWSIPNAINRYYIRDLILHGLTMTNKIHTLKFKIL